MIAGRAVSCPKRRMADTGLGSMSITVPVGVFYPRVSREVVCPSSEHALVQPFDPQSAPSIARL